MTLGTFLLARRNRDKSLLLTRLDLLLRQDAWGRLRLIQRLRSYRQRRRREARERLKAERASAAANGDVGGAPAAPGVVLRLPQPRLPFPNTLDRYVLVLFARVLVMVLAAGTTVYIVANFTDLVDDVLRNEVPSSVVVDYYKYLSLQIVHTIAPFVVLLTTLVSFGLLSRTNEVIAVRALGVSLYRLALPVLVASVLFAGADAVLASTILPHSNERVAELRDRIRGVERVRTYRSADQQWLYGDGGYLYNYQYYEARRATLQRLHVFRADPDRHVLTGVLYAEEAQFREDGRWWVSGGWARSFETGTVTSYRTLAGPQPVDLPERPAFFDSEIKQPDLMGYRDLRAYVRRLELGGQEVPELRLRLLEKVAMPAVVLVMAVVALPFAFRLGRRGALYGIGIALALGIVFYAVIAIFRTLGEAGVMPTEVAAWGPSVLFATGSMYLFLGVRT
jgi:LPS export ABC transporter permease LptG